MNCIIFIQLSLFNVVLQGNIHIQVGFQHTKLMIGNISKTDDVIGCRLIFFALKVTGLGVNFTRKLFATKWTYFIVVPVCLTACFPSWTFSLQPQNLSLMFLNGSRNQDFRQSILYGTQEYVDSCKTHDIRLLLTRLVNLPVPQHQVIQDDFLKPGEFCF